jgi:hypothetical protein
VLATGLILLSGLDAAHAGCGCQKAPPAASYLRPAATYPGMPVTLIHPGLQAGKSYIVTFSSGVQSASAAVTGTAVSRRDLADGVTKPQLAVNLPALPLGPAAVSVKPSGGKTPLMQLSDDQLTVTPAPVAIPQGATQLRLLNYRAAVSRDRDVYLALDFTGVNQARVFRARLEGVPLRFAATDALFYNVQGFLMQRLDSSMPGLFTIASGSSTVSDALTYSRHEFNTYFLQHAENLSHAVDPADGNWHLDGSRHIDHDRQILQLGAMLPTGSLAPGATAPATLVIDIQTLFHQGLFGTLSLSMNNASTVDSYHASGAYGFGGDVASNGVVSVSNASRVDGNARGAIVSAWNGGAISGSVQQGAMPIAMLPVAMPSGLTSQGDVKVSNSASRRFAVGSYRLKSLLVENTSTLYIDNASGPVTLYVEQGVTVKNSSRVVVQDPDPEKFAIYAAGGGSVLIDNGGAFYGVIYAPSASVTLSNAGDLHGSFVGRDVWIDNGAAVHYDRALRGE